MLSELFFATTILLSGSVGTFKGDNLSSVNPMAETWEYVDELEDGAVYFIRNALYDSKVLDVPNGNYSDNTEMILYSSLGWGNQRFVLNKEFIINGKQTYSLSPVEDETKVLRIEDKSDSENKKLQIQTKTDYSGSYKADKFYFTEGSVANSYRISTAISGFSKYLTTDNFSVADSTKIVQKSLDNSSIKCYDWYLQKTDSLGINSNNEVYINGKNEAIFNIRVPRDGKYVIETSLYNSNVDTYLTLFNKEGNILSSNDDGGEGDFSKIVLNLSSKQDYYVKVRGYNDSVLGKVFLSLRSEKIIYMNTYVEENDIDTRSDSISPSSNLKDAGYFVKNLTNESFTNMNVIDFNGNSKFNNDYYMISSHGSKGGGVLLSPYSIFYGRDLPNMSNVKLAVWAICYGGKSGNVAEYSVLYKNVQNSLGFLGLTYDNTSKTFTDKLWSEIANGKSVSDSVSSAINHVKSSYWWKNIFGWGDDTIVSPQLYSKSASIFKLNSAHNLLDFNLFDTLELSSIDELEEFVNKNEVIKSTPFENATFYLKKIDDKITNEFYILNNSTQAVFKHLANVDSESSMKIAVNPIESKKFSLPSNSEITLENSFVLNLDQKQKNIKRVQYITHYENYDSLEEKFYDADTYKEILEEIILKSFL